MKKIVFISLTLIALGFSEIVTAQTNQVKKKVNPNLFDENAAREQAKAKGIIASDVEGYVKFLKNNFLSKQALAKQRHVHTPYESAGTPAIQETVIYIEPGKPMSLGCPNMGFEQILMGCLGDCFPLPPPPKHPITIQTTTVKQGSPPTPQNHLISTYQECICVDSRPLCLMLVGCCKY